MVDDLKLTVPMMKALDVFMKAKGYRATGADIIKEAGLASGTVYPLLSRMEQGGWLRAEWENVVPSEAGRPRRRYYFLTGAGQRAARDAYSGVGLTARWAT